jgi:hypothetical protein
VTDGILRALQGELGADAVVSSRLLPMDESAKAEAAAALQAEGGAETEKAASAA